MDKKIQLQIPNWVLVVLLAVLVLFGILPRISPGASPDESNTSPEDPFAQTATAASLSFATTEIALQSTALAGGRSGASFTACVQVSTLQVRAGPGFEHPVIGELFSGDCLPVDARNADQSWVRLRSGLGWVTAASLDLPPDISALPVESAPAAASPFAASTEFIAIPDIPGGEPDPTLGVVGCPVGCLEQIPGCDIKGNISFTSGNKIYHVPGGEFYNQTQIDAEQGERWFCTEEEAVANGWRASAR
jgi:hypothetical protein